MSRFFYCLCAPGVLIVSMAVLLAQRLEEPRPIPLPTSKLLTAPSLGRIGAVNSFPATIALSPDGRYAALLNDGYGTQLSKARQSIAILDLQTNLITDFPDDRLGEDAHQSYFLGLAFSSDGEEKARPPGSVPEESMGNLPSMVRHLPMAS